MLDTPYGQGPERTAWVLHHALSMLEAAQGAMPTVAISGEEAVELRFGRRIERVVSQDTVAYVPADANERSEADVVAIIGRANAHQAKPITVFPVQ